MTKKVVFFRDDDVRHTLEKELVDLVEVFTNAGVPISLAVEPANVTDAVVKWVTDQKKQYPDLIEIIQHGYDHNKNGIYPSGSEFGTYRKFDDQLADIQKGQQLMDTYFPGIWFPAMAFPYGNFNTHSLQALEQSNFKVMTSGICFSVKNRVKDFIGTLFSQDILLGKKVKQHAKIRKKYHFLELDASVNIIKKYLSENDAIHFSLEEIIQAIENNARYNPVVGVLFHHRFHKGQFQDIKKLLDWLKKNDYEFSTLESLYSRFQKTKGVLVP